MPRRVLAASVALALTLAVSLAVLLPSTADAAKLPSKNTWVSDTYKALNGSRAYVRSRVAKGGTKLALNLDIDNTSLATYYETGKPVAATLRLVKYAKSKGVYILFNTGRNVSLRAKTIAGLKRAGYPVDGLCAHYKGEPLRHSKQRCRQSFVNNGFTIIANIGNRSTDFTGSNYERAYRLPNYGNRLG
jgi:predicted secreted acid phosphatase